MPPIRFLSVENVIEIHEQEMKVHGGLSGLRDLGLLESAVMMPRAQFGGQYLHEDIPTMAAAYLFHIAQAHAFRDGNKRTAVLSALVFLDHNGFEVTADNDDIIDVGLNVASGELDKSGVIHWMHSFAQPKKR